MARPVGVLLVLALAASCGGGGGAASADALAGALASDDGGDLDAEGASCVAVELVELLGPDALEDLDGGADEITDAELDDVDLDPDDPDDAEDVAEAFESCDVDLDDVDASDLRGLAGDLVELALVDAYVRGVAELLAGDDELEDAGRGDRRCVAEAIARGAGLEALVDAGDLGDYDDAEELAELDLDIASDIEDIAEDAGDCDVDLDDVAAPVLEELSFFGGDEATCIAESLGDDVVDRLAVAALVLGEDAALTEAEPFDDLIDEIDDAIFGCEPDFEDFEDIEPPDFEDSAYVDELITALLEDPVPADPAQATCLAETWSRNLGVGFFAEVLGIVPSDLGDLDDLADVGLIDEEVDLLVDAATSCRLALPGLVLALLNTPVLTPEQVTCFLAVLADPEVAADAVESILTGDPGTDDPAAAAVEAALAGCGIPD